VAGVLLLKFKLLVAHSVSMPWKLAPANAGVRLQELAEIFSTMNQQCAPLAWFCALYYAVLLTLAPATLLGKGRWRLTQPEAAWLGMVSLSATAGLLLVMVLSSSPATPRYLIPAALLPLVLSPALVFAQWRERQPAVQELVRSLLLGVAALASAGMAHTVSAGGALKTEYYPEQIACIDRVLAQYDAQHGFAGYWEAGWLAMNSHRLPTVAPVEADLQPFTWITTLSNFRAGYDFALVAAQHSDSGGPVQATVIARNGQPQAVAGCGAINVLIYARGSAVLK
jgi:hypothetical protein